MSAAEVPIGPPPTPTEPKISAPAALAGTFTSPGKTFERLAKAPTWWLPLVVALVTTLLAVLVVTPKMDVESSVRQQMEKQAEKRGGTVSDEQVQQAMAVSGKFAALTPVFATVFGAIAFFVTALVLWGMAQAFGGETRYAQVLAVWGHGQLPNIVSALLSIPVFLARPDASILQQEASTVFKTSIGSFLSLESPAALRAFLGSIDVFSIATVVLLVVGFRRLPGLTKGTGAAVPLVAWGIWIVLKTLWMAVFG